MFGRREARTHGQLMRAELGEGVDHFWQAATHAAGGVGATVGPRWTATRERVAPGVVRVRNSASHGWESTRSTLTPLIDAARTGSINAKASAKATAARAKNKTSKTRESRMSGKRTGLLVGLLAAGAAAGAAGAYVVRRRNRAKWEEYESQAIGAAKDGAGAAADSAKSSLDGAAEQTANGAHAASARGADALDLSRAKTEDLADKAAAAAKNSRG